MNGLSYVTQHIKEIGLGSNATPLTLTASDQTSTTVVTKNSSKMVLYVEYTPAENSRNLTVTIEFGDDNGNWFPLTVGYDAAVSGGNVNTTLNTNKFIIPGTTASTTYPRRYAFEIGDKLARVKVKEDGAGTFGTAYVQAAVSGI